MTLQGDYLGMPVTIADLDEENHSFYSFCGQGELRLQSCSACNKLRTPPTTACPYCTSEGATWVILSGKGTVYSYGEVHHAIQSSFRTQTPYSILLVELDEQKETPGPEDGLRLIGNLANTDGTLASPELVSSIGIGTRVEVVFAPIGDGIAQPLWRISKTEEQPKSPWRYPIE